MTTIVPANPGYFVLYPPRDGDPIKDPIIAWQCTAGTQAGQYQPITLMLVQFDIGNPILCPDGRVINLEQDDDENAPLGWPSVDAWIAYLQAR
jgi:hypothetical protein